MASKYSRDDMLINLHPLRSAVPECCQLVSYSNPSLNHSNMMTDTLTAAGLLYSIQLYFKSGITSLDSKTLHGSMNYTQ